MTSGRTRLRDTALVTAAVSAAIIVLHWFHFDPLQRAEFYSRDLRAVLGRKATLDQRLAFVAIDKASVQLDQIFPDEVEASPALKMMSQGFPWSRAVYAQMLDQLFAAGARVVIFDLLFPQPNPGDAAFRDALERHRDRVVLACDFVYRRAGGGMAASLDLPIATLIPPAAPPDPRLGFDTFWPDSDNVIRRMRFATSLRELNLYASGDDQRYESIAARALTLLGRPGLVPKGERLFRYAGPAGTIRAHSIYELFVSKLWSANYENGAFFRDKIVIVGPEGSWSHDEHPTPFRVLGSAAPLMSGAEIHLQALNAALHRDYLRELPRHRELLLLVVAAIVAFAISLLQSPWLRVAAVLSAGAAYAIAAGLLFNSFGLFVPIVSPVLIGITAATVNVVTDLRRERLEKTRLRSTLERYVSEEVVTELVANPASYLNALGGVRKNVTVLFSDLRNFTGHTIGRDASELVEQLNEYFSAMTDHVFAHGGTVDKLMGDSLMAIWGSLRTAGAAQDAEAAVRTAVDMTSSLRRLNERWRSRGWPEFRFGIGIAQGDALVGNVGSERKMDFTAIGDVTNVAAKIEELTVELECAIVVSDTIAAVVANQFDLRAAGPIWLAGRPSAINVFILEPHAPKTSPPE